jgi:hypothetical protein
MALRYDKATCVAAELFFSNTKVTHRQYSLEFQCFCSAGAAVRHKSLDLPDRDTALPDHARVRKAALSAKRLLPDSSFASPSEALALSAIRIQGSDSETQAGFSTVCLEALVPADHLRSLLLNGIDLLDLFFNQREQALAES